MKTLWQIAAVLIKCQLLYMFYVKFNIVLEERSAYTAGIDAFVVYLQNYTELIELASKGNPRNVDLCVDAMFKTTEPCDDDDSLYRKAIESASTGLVYCMEKRLVQTLVNSFFTQYSSARFIFCYLS